MKPTTREVINLLDWELIFAKSERRSAHRIACLRRAIAIVRASSRVKASRKGRAKR